MQATILVVDDERDLCNALGDILRDEGYGVYCAYGAEEALDFLDGAGPSLPQLCLVDFFMPGMTGGEFRIRQMANPRTASIPILLMSAMTAANLAPTAWSAVNDAGVVWIEKPFALDSLLATIAALVASPETLLELRPARPGVASFIRR